MERNKNERENQNGANACICKHPNGSGFMILARPKLVLNMRKALDWVFD